MLTCVADPPPMGTKASVGFVRAKTSRAVPRTKTMTELHGQKIYTILSLLPIIHNIGIGEDARRIKNNFYRREIVSFGGKTGGLFSNVSILAV